MDDTLDLELRLGPRDASPWSNGAAAEGPGVDLLLSTDARKGAVCAAKVDLQAPQQDDEEEEAAAAEPGSKRSKTPSS